MNVLSAWILSFTVLPVRHGDGFGLFNFDVRDAVESSAIMTDLSLDKPENFLRTAVGANLSEWMAAVNASALDRSSCSSFIETGLQQECAQWPPVWQGKLESSDCNIINGGSFGAVYRTTMTCNSSVLVAVKVQDQTKQRLPTEVMMMNAFSSSYFVTFFDWERDASQRKDFILMEFAAGGDFDSHLRKHQLPKHLTMNLRLFFDVANGVKEMHQTGAVHRDLKPGNVLISPSCDGPTPCRAKVADLGGSCFMKDCEGIFGTPFYMAPETLTLVLTPEAHYAWTPVATPAKADIWALGIILHEIIFGKRPQSFRAASTDDKLYDAIKKFDIRIYDSYGHAEYADVTVKRVVKGLLKGMLQPSVELRMTATQVVEELQRILVPSNVVTPTLTRPRCWDEPTRERKEPLKIPAWQQIVQDRRAKKEEGKLAAEPSGGENRAKQEAPEEHCFTIRTPFSRTLTIILSPDVTNEKGEIQGLILSENLRGEANKLQPGDVVSRVETERKKYTWDQVYGKTDVLRGLLTGGAVTICYEHVERSADVRSADVRSDRLFLQAASVGGH